MMARPDKIAGQLQVGATDEGHVVVNGGPAALDADGNWHIVFSSRQARDFARVILKQAAEAEAFKLKLPTLGEFDEAVNQATGAAVAEQQLKGRKARAAKAEWAAARDALTKIYTRLRDAGAVRISASLEAPLVHVSEYALCDTCVERWRVIGRGISTLTRTTRSDRAPCSGSGEIGVCCVVSTRHVNTWYLWAPL